VIPEPQVVYWADATIPPPGVAEAVKTVARSSL
jgi:hypothetical protein